MDMVADRACTHEGSLNLPAECALAKVGYNAMKGMPRQRKALPVVEVDRLKIERQRT